MNYDIDKNAPVPAYLQLYRKLADDIAAGGYPYGSKLPSKRTLAEETGVSVITAEHAIALLVEEGYVQSRQRSGNYVIYRGEDFLGSAGREEALAVQRPRETHDTGDFPFSVLAKTMRRVLLDYGEDILVKSPNHGCKELRTEISRYIKRSRGINVEPARVIIGSGAEYLYGLVAQLLGPGRRFAIEDPSYGKIRAVYEAMGCKVEALPMTADGIASEALERTEAEALHVTPFNSFPSGVTAGISKKAEYIRWARQRDGYLIEDNYASELTVSRKAEEPLLSMCAERVIYINTFSGTLAPGMRIGYMLLPDTLTKEFNERLGFYSCTVPIFEQYVIAELLRNGDFERHINRIRRRKRRNSCIDFSTEQE